MKKVIRKIAGIFFLIEFIISVFLAFTNLKEHPFAAFFTCLFFGVVAFLLLRHPKNKEFKIEQPIPDVPINDNDITSETGVDMIENTTDNITPTYVESENMIYRVNVESISDEEIPYLIEVSKQNAFEQYEQSSNPKFYRIEREKDLCTQFMMNHGNEIQKHTDSFENHYRLAYAENDLNKKIELLQKTIDLYEKEKKWFYRTKGGTIYFQDYYEHMSNSKNNDFSYIDSVKEYLENCINKRDYVIPEIINLISSSNGILQKDIYKHLPDISKSDIQKTIRELENVNLITRTKKSNSYFLTLK